MEIGDSGLGGWSGEGFARRHGGTEARGFARARSYRGGPRDGCAERGLRRLEVAGAGDVEGLETGVGHVVVEGLGAAGAVGRGGAAEVVGDVGELAVEGGTREAGEALDLGEGVPVVVVVDHGWSVSDGVGEREPQECGDAVTRGTLDEGDAAGAAVVVDAGGAAGAGPAGGFVVAPGAVGDEAPLGGEHVRFGGVISDEGFAGGDHDAGLLFGVDAEGEGEGEKDWGLGLRDWVEVEEEGEGD